MSSKSLWFVLGKFGVGAVALLLLSLGGVAAATAFDRYQEWSYAMSSTGSHLRAYADSYQTEMFVAGGASLVAFVLGGACWIGSLALGQLAKR